MPRTKKITGKFLAILLIALSFFTLAPHPTHAEQASFFKDQCKKDQCCLQYTGAMGAAEADWNTYVKDLLAEPKATSKKVEKAFDGLRTYDCWIRYVCESVRLSGLVNPKEIQDGIRAENLDGSLPGCQAPQDVHFGNNWAEFVAALDNQDDLIKAINQPNKIAYFPACMTNPPLNQSLTLQEAQQAELQYNNCLSVAEVILGCTGENCQSQTPSAMAGLEISLKKDHAEQRASALERKLYDINRRTLIMQEVVEQVKNFFLSLDLRYECAPFRKCA